MGADRYWLVLQRFKESAAPLDLTDFCHKAYTRAKNLGWISKLCIRISLFTENCGGKINLCEIFGVYICMKYTFMQDFRCVLKFICERNIHPIGVFLHWVIEIYRELVWVRYSSKYKSGYDFFNVGKWLAIQISLLRL